MSAPAILVVVVGPAGGTFSIAVVETLVGGDKVDGFSDAGIVQVAPAQQAKGHVAGETGDDQVRITAAGRGGLVRKTAGPGILGIFQYKFAGFFYAGISRIGG